MSCVVKCCKNRSDRRKEHPGITFHRFSKNNDVWRNDWIKIIRNCNAEKEWIPNKYSVICSIHFEAKDLYITKGGSRRVVTYAVPQKARHFTDNLKNGKHFFLRMNSRLLYKELKTPIYEGKSVLLTNHLRTHTGEKPFPCALCGRAFSQRTARATHVKLVHLKVRRNKAIKNERPVAPPEPKPDLFPKHEPQIVYDSWSRPCDVFYVTAGP